MESMLKLDALAARVRLRIAYIAAGLADYEQQPGLRRIRLSSKLTVYSHLFQVPDGSLLDVEADSKSLESVFKEYAESSSVVSTFSVANGTNVRLWQGESVVCCGEDELVSLKLTQDEIVTYRSPESSQALLQEVLQYLGDQVEEGVLHRAQVFKRRTTPPRPKN